MGLAEKIKTGLDEARMEVLGAQVLIGFQFRGAFEPGFDRLPAASRFADTAALLLMLVTLTLLIFPSVHQRVVERGCDSERFLRLTRRASSWALGPFAAAIGLDVGIVCKRIWSAAGGILAGAGAAALAALLWSGARLRSLPSAAPEGTRMSSDEVRDPGLHVKIDQMLTEARVILPGAQALLGFQLSIVLTDAFEKLEPLAPVHGMALLLIGGWQIGPALAARARRRRAPS